MAPKGLKKAKPGNQESEQESVRIETRFDPAHVSAAHSSKSSDSAEAHPVLAGSNSSAAGAQIQAQADQLASYLRSRQRNIDQREADLNARLAVLDSEGRRERLLLSQREAELAERDEALTLRERELEERLKSVAAAEASCKEHQAVLLFVAPAGRRPGSPPPAAASRLASRAPEGGRELQRFSSSATMPVSN